MKLGKIITHLSLVLLGIPVLSHAEIILTGDLFVAPVDDRDVAIFAFETPTYLPNQWTYGEVGLVLPTPDELENLTIEQSDALFKNSAITQVGLGEIGAGTPILTDPDITLDLDLVINAKRRAQTAVENLILNYYYTFHSTELGSAGKACNTSLLVGRRNAPSSEFGILGKILSGAKAAGKAVVKGTAWAGKKVLTSTAATVVGVADLCVDVGEAIHDLGSGQIVGNLCRGMIPTSGH